MVLSALLAVLLLSGLLSSMNFKALDMELLLPARAFAGETLPFSVRIRNRRRVFPAFSFKQNRREEAVFPWFSPGTVHASGETRFARRGRYTFERLKIASRFPFGFFARTRNYPVDTRVHLLSRQSSPGAAEVSVTDILGIKERLSAGWAAIST